MSAKVGRGTGALPPGVKLAPLSRVRDQRGSLVEIHRHAPDDGQAQPRQWNALVSVPNTLRGMHVHVQHTDWIAVVHGAARVAMVDLRGGRDAARAPAVMIDLVDESHAMLVVPPGVLHGFYTAEHSVLLNGLSHEYDERDDLAVRYDDHALGVEWGAIDPVLSERDRDAGDLASLFAELATRGEQLPSLPR